MQRAVTAGIIAAVTVAIVYRRIAINRRDRSRWLFSLGRLLSDNVPIDHALEAIRRRCRTRALTLATEEARARVQEGEGLSVLLKPNLPLALFGKGIQTAVDAAERSGNLPSALMELSGNAGKTESCHMSRDEQPRTITLEPAAQDIAPVPKIAHMILYDAIQQGESKVSIEPVEGPYGIQYEVYFTSDSGSRELWRYPLSSYINPALFNYIKLLADIPYWLNDNSKGSFFADVDKERFTVTASTSGSSLDEVIEIVITYQTA